MMSRPEAAMGQQHDWMGVGLSKPEQIFIMFEGNPSSAKVRRGLKVLRPRPFMVILCSL